MKVSKRYLLLHSFLILVASLSATSAVHAQTFGVELHNTLMPASGGMGGVSIARPQDVPSSLNGNPATLTQFKGTQFHFGGAWVGPTFDMTQTSPIPLLNVLPYSAKSSAPGVPVANIGVTQDLSELGLPITFGAGFVTTSGALIDFRSVPASNGTNAALIMFSAPVSVGVDVTDRLTVGSTLSMGISFFDGPFVGSGGLTPAYALRGTVGANYLLDEYNTVGSYYQTEQSQTFGDAITFNPGPGQKNLDVSMQLPQNIGLGFANTALMDGKLLLGVDLLYKLWENADLFKSIYHNQLVAQFGTQYSVGKYRWRLGYVWAENPVTQFPGNNLGGVISPGGLPSARYSQGLLAVTAQNRITGGVGVVDVLPGIDLDMMAGGMFRDSEQLGPVTQTAISSYWVGFGLTWRFNRGNCERSMVPDRFCNAVSH